jgi:hypothetical protein
MTTSLRNTRILKMPKRALEAGRRGTAVAATLVAIAVPAGCGSGSSDSSSPGAQAATNIEHAGEEAGATDRAAVTSTVQGFLKARAAGDWARACSLMTASTKQNLVFFLSERLKSRDCTKLLAELTATTPPKTLAKDERIQVTGVRVDGDRGFVLYSDANGTASDFPVTREGNAWKVGAIAGTRIP